MGPQWATNIRIVENKKQMEEIICPDVSKLSFYFRDCFQATGPCDMLA